MPLLKKKKTKQKRQKRSNNEHQTKSKENILCENRICSGGGEMWEISIFSTHFYCEQNYSKKIKSVKIQHVADVFNQDIFNYNLYDFLNVANTYNDEILKIKK